MIFLYWLLYIAWVCLLVSWLSHTLPEFYFAGQFADPRWVNINDIVTGR